VILSEAVRIGREKSIPAAIGVAAGAGLLILFAPAAPPLAVALAGIGMAGGQELVKTGVQAAVARILGKREPVPGLSPTQRADGARRRAGIAVDSC